MADEADVAQDEVEFWTKRALEVRYPTMARNGRCHYCGAPVGADRIFCPNDFPKEPGCATDYQNEQEARRRAGLR
jgi:hypothetical protein